MYTLIIRLCNVYANMTYICWCIQSKLIFLKILYKIFSWWNPIFRWECSTKQITTNKKKERKMKLSLRINRNQPNEFGIIQLKIWIFFLLFYGNAVTMHDWFCFVVVGMMGVWKRLAFTGRGFFRLAKIYE